MRIAVFQSRTGIEPEENAARLRAAIATAAADGADMLFTPEMSNLLDRDRGRAAARLTDETHDPVLASVRDAAADAGIWVHLGSIALAGERVDGRLANRGLVMDDKGDVRARYDKVHLFDVTLPGGESWCESAAYGPGDASVIVRTPWAPVGLSICYDLRFPDLYRALSDGGATVIAVPAAFTVTTGKAHWHVLLRARAIEAGAFVIAAAQTGVHQDGRATYGHSLVVDPWGEVLLDMGDAEGVACVDLDLDRVAEARARIPALTHRRPIAAPVIM